jgi:hypothetical protein
VLDEPCLEAVMPDPHALAGRIGAMTKNERRFQRQFDMLGRLIPPLRGPMSTLRRTSWFPVRFPLAVLLTLGGLLWFLPVLGIWMLPLGLLLLAVDLPMLRGPISAVIVRGRRRIVRWTRHWRDRRGPRP